MGRVLRFLRGHWLEALAVASIIGIVIGVDPRKLARVFARLSWLPAALMVPVVIAVYTSRALAWWVTMRKIGLRISFWRTWLIEVAGQTLIFLPAGDLARAAMVEESGAGGHDAGEIAGTITFSEFILMTVIGLGVVPRLVVRPDVGLLVLIMLAAHVAIVVMLCWERAYDSAIGLVTRIRLLRRFEEPLKNLRDTFVRLLDWRSLAAVIAIDLVTAALTFLLFYLGLTAVGVHHLSFVEAAFVLSLGHLLAGLSLLPAGAGVFEGLLIALLYGFGVPASQGAAAALIFRAYNDVVMAGFGAMAGVLLKRLAAGGRGERLEAEQRRRQEREASKAELG
jgi:uncharacterized protein (TIRG00374 family)